MKNNKTPIAERAAKKFDEAAIDTEITKAIEVRALQSSPPTIKLPVGTVVAYIEMNGRTYYIDDSTGEAIAESWPTDDPDLPFLGQGRKEGDA